MLKKSEAKSELQRHQRLIESMLEMANERLMAVLFWFVILGPMGAIIYRITVELEQRTRGEENSDGLNEAATRLRAIMNWLPARITALIYAIAGSFVDALRLWKEKSGEWSDDWVASNRGVLIASGVGALNFNHLYAADEELDREVAKGQVVQALALIRRSIIVWLTVLAFMTLGGWLV